MQNSSIEIIIIWLLTFLISGTAFAGVLDISKVGMGARSLAMGRAQAAAADVGSVFANPAAASEFDTFAMTSMYSNFAEDVTYNVLGGVFPLKEGAFGSLGIGYIGAAVSDIFVTTSEVRTPSTSSIDYNNRLLILSYGREVNSFLKGGAALKFLTRTFGSLSGGAASGVDLDLGFLFYPKDNITAGLSLQNLLTTQLIWTSGAKEDIPMNIKMGLNMRPRKNLTVLVDYNSDRNLNIGLEIGLRQVLSIRGGLQFVPINSRDSVLNYALGVGLKVRGFDFDYAYYYDSLLSSNSSHFISVSFVLPGRYIDSQPILPAWKENTPLSFN